MHSVPRLSQLTAAVLVGGAGTRLRPVVADRPKPLALVGGKPFLAHLLDQLDAQGLEQVVLCTGYLGDQIQAAFGESYRRLKLTYSREGQPLGTGGALRRALPHLASDPLLILNGDSFCETDFAAALRWHLQLRARATLVLAHVDDCARFGAVETGAGGQIQAFLEKSGTPAPGWINSGVYWLERALIAQIPPGQPFSLERDLFASWRAAGLCGYRQDGRFLDIGVPDDFARAERFLAEVTGPVTALAV